MEIRRWKTAMSRPKESPTARAVVATFPKGRILDYGCGRGKDVTFYGDRGTGYDPGPFGYDSPPSGSFEVVVNNFVLNVIEDQAERKTLVERLKGFLGEGGRLVLVARATGEINGGAKKGGWEVFGDGYLTGLGTFQKGFSKKELLALGKAAGLKEAPEKLKLSGCAVVVLQVA